MKKIFIAFIALFTIGISVCYSKDYSLNFDGTKYYLLYSVKNKDFGGYLNEYYKKGETYNIWSDMVAVHHFPNAYSPIDRIKDFKDYLSSMNIPSSLTFNDKDNTAMIDFIMIKSNKLPIVLEFNIFKYEKSEKCGSIAVQYVKRYSATTTMQIEGIKKEFENNRKHLINKVKNFKIPNVVTEDIDKCISGLEVNSQEKISSEIKETTTEAKQEELAEEIIKNENSADSEIVTTEQNEKETKVAEENNNNSDDIADNTSNIGTETAEENTKEDTKNIQPVEEIAASETANVTTDKNEITEEKLTEKSTVAEKEEEQVIEKAEEELKKDLSEQKEPEVPAVITTKAIVPAVQTNTKNQEG